MNTQYTRVIPRDLFNEAKLLKCMGWLCLQIHDRNNLPADIQLLNEGSELTGEPFEIALMDEGALTITNLYITINGKNFSFKTIYNSKANYPLYVDGEEVVVFNEDGKFSEEFKEFCKSIPAQSKKRERSKHVKQYNKPNKQTKN